MPVLSWEDPLTGDTVAVTFDVVDTVTRTVDTELTEHPVETGSDIVDHARTMGMMIEMTGYVSNTPLYSTEGGEKNASWQEVELPGPVQRIPISYAGSISTPSGHPQSLSQAVTGPLIGAVSGTPRATMLVRDWVSRVREIEDLLRGAQEGAYFISLDDSAQAFDNLIITSRGVTRRVEDGDGASFSLSLKRIRTVSAQLVDAPEPAELRGSPIKSLGSKAAAPAVGDEEKEKVLKENLSGLFSGGNKSALASLVDLASGS